MASSAGPARTAVGASTKKTAADAAKIVANFTGDLRSCAPVIGAWGISIGAATRFSERGRRCRQSCVQSGCGLFRYKRFGHMSNLWAIFKMTRPQYFAWFTGGNCKIIRGFSASEM
jgi:hypothetical protein